MTAAELLQAIGVYVTNKVGLVRKAELGGKVLKPIVEYFAQKEVEQKVVNESLWEAVDGKVNKDGNKVLTDENFSTADKQKLDGISENANNYEHPATHSAEMITESATKRFVSDSEKQTWNAKQDALTIDVSLSTTSLNPIQNKAVASAISEVESIAKGATRTSSFDTENDMTAALKIAAKDDYKIGDNLYVIEQDVPDYWISNVLGNNTGEYGYFEISELETEKVDLSEYAKTDEVPTALSELAPDDNNQRVSKGDKTNWDSKVNGPASSTNNYLPIFDGTTGKLLKESRLNFNEDDTSRKLRNSVLDNKQAEFVLQNNKGTWSFVADSSDDNEFKLYSSKFTGTPFKINPVDKSTTINNRLIISEEGMSVKLSTTSGGILINNTTAFGGSGVITPKAVKTTAQTGATANEYLTKAYADDSYVEPMDILENNAVTTVTVTCEGNKDYYYNVLSSININLSNQFDKFGLSRITFDTDDSFTATLDSNIKGITASDILPNKHIIITLEGMYASIKTFDI